MVRRKLKPKYKKIFNVFVVIFGIACIVGIVYSTYKIINWNKNVNDNKDIRDKHKDKIKIDSTGGKVSYNIDFKSLKEQNPDTIAYIKVNDTNIEYVVVKGRDNKYYLTHNFDKNWNVAGWIFADYHNKFDGTDKNIVIYGHNTRDGSMFETLINVLDKAWYENEENHEVILVTEMGTYFYEVFSTYSIIPEDYYINTVFYNDEDFNTFVNKIKSRSNYDYGVEVNGTSKILTLSSCIGDGRKRVVLHAVKKEGE